MAEIVDAYVSEACRLADASPRMLKVGEVSLLFLSRDNVRVASHAWHSLQQGKPLQSFSVPVFGAVSITANTPSQWGDIRSGPHTSFHNECRRPLNTARNPFPAGDAYLESDTVFGSSRR
jgi:hypothetical protein